MSYFLFGLKEVAKECPRNRDALLGMGVMTWTKMDNRCRGNVEKMLVLLIDHCVYSQLSEIKKFLIGGGKQAFL